MEKKIAYLNLRIKKEEKEKIRDFAKRERRSMTQFILKKCLSEE